MSRGDGTFADTWFSTSFAGWASTSGVQPIAGDFNNDGKADIALTGVSGWTTIPVAFSNGDGTFNVTNQPAGQFAGWASGYSVKAIPGDFNGDHRMDIALQGYGQGWTTIPVALSGGNGSFTIVNGASDFAALAAGGNVPLVSGDFNGDGGTDLALPALVNSGQDPVTGLGGPSYTGPTLPVAFANAGATFTLTNRDTAAFTTMIDGVPGSPADFDPGSCKNLVMCQGGDVDNDHLLDMVGFVPPDTTFAGLAGVVMVALAAGDEGTLRPWRIWGTGFCAVAGQECRVESVSNPGDGADIIQFQRNTPGQVGDVLVSLNDPVHSTFRPATKWNDFLCPNPGETCEFAYLNNDSYIDAIDFVRSQRFGHEGEVWVALGNGASSFAPATLWLAGGTAPGLCRNAEEICKPALIDNDRSVDLVELPNTANNSLEMGKAYVAYNRIGVFAARTLAGGGPYVCANADWCVFADVDGDGDTDAISEGLDDPTLASNQRWVSTNDFATFREPHIVTFNDGSTASISTTSDAGPESQAVNTTFCSDLQTVIYQLETTRDNLEREAHDLWVAVMDHHGEVIFALFKANRYMDRADALRSQASYLQILISLDQAIYDANCRTFQ
jgi:hypothetical protein